ncbi:cleavage stimulation factor subunit 3 [Trichonephila clavipes]|nr:cleavage stimulation factor subunit 3 [Trichonephila clavipes]
MSLFEDQSHLGFINDRIKKAEKRLEQNSYDVEAWSIIVRDAQNKKMEDARPYYEKVVAQFPSAGRYWKLYIEHEVTSLGNVVVDPWSL